MYRIISIIAISCSIVNNVSGDTNYRLNTTIKPSHYTIAITPYFETGDEKAFTFDGEVTINIQSDVNVKQIKLHSEDLKFSASNITVTSGNVIIALAETNPLVFDEKYTFAYINLETELQANTDYTLRIVYTGPIRSDLNGLYRNYYIENGVKKWLAATQMEPTHARKVFPCFDEPNLKAVFTLMIDRPASYEPSLANTILANTIPLANGNVREVFSPTPIMSTYLVAFLVSEFKAAQTITTNGEEFGVYTRPEAANQSQYAYEFGRKVVSALGDYYGISYYWASSALKLDHVALPDFRAGAMENWGLINYRESLLLYVPEESSPYYKYRVAQIVAHETTHMWFGNLVTCHWWSDTWLNEGFANYFQDYITAIVEPELRSDNILVTGSVYAAYEADDSPDSAPISNDNVNSPAEISGHFGTITYQKAGSVIRMMHHLIGDEAFQTALNVYLMDNRFTPGHPEQLYTALHDGVTRVNSLADYPGVTITEVMKTWIEQPGHPILQVDINYESGTATLTQKRFYINSSKSSDEIYTIPVTYTTGASPDFNITKPALVMKNKTQIVSIPNITQSHSWVLFNIQETGFYRVNYDTHSWQMISAALKGDQREAIHYLNRAKIVNDLFAFVYGDVVKFEQLYHLLEFLEKETDYSVWYAVIRGLNKFKITYTGTHLLEDIDTFALGLLQSIINTLGFEVRPDDDYETIRNRMQVLEFACKLKHQGCIDYVVALFKGLKENGTEITPSLRTVSYCNGLRYGDADDYDFLWQRMSTTNVANEARTIGEVLGCTNNEEKLKAFLSSMLEVNSPIKFQDITVPLSGVLGNYGHLHIVLDVLKEDYSFWSTIYPSMDTVLSTIGSSLHSNEDFDAFEAFLANCQECTEQSMTAAYNAIDNARESKRWANNHLQDFWKFIGSDAAIRLPSVLVIFLGFVIVYLSI